MTEALPRDPSTKLGLSPTIGPWVQFGAVGLIGAILVMVMSGVGVATYNLVGQQLQRSHEDRVAERAAEREERRHEREQFAAEGRSTRDILSRVSATLERIDKTQAEQATQLTELARILERLQRKSNEAPPISRIHPWGEWVNARLTTFAVAATIGTFAPPDAAPSRADVVFPTTPVKVVEPPPPANPDAITVAVGRFAWAYVRRDIPVSYYVAGDAVEKLDLPAGTPFAGIRFDDAATARPKAHTPPAEAKGRVCVLLGSAVGTARVQVWGNPGEGKDPELLASITVRVVESAAKPSPDPPAIPQSQLLPKLRPAFAAMDDHDKRQLVAMAAVGMEWAAAAIDDPKYTDAGSFEAAVAATQKQLIGNAARLRPFGPTIGEALLAAIPTTDPTTKLTPAIRAAWKSTYRDAAVAYRSLAESKE